jgi:hypothetical protein
MNCGFKGRVSVHDCKCKSRLDLIALSSFFTRWQSCRTLGYKVMRRPRDSGDNLGNFSWNVLVAEVPA